MIVDRVNNPFMPVIKERVLMARDWRKYLDESDSRRRDRLVKVEKIKKQKRSVRGRVVDDWLFDKRNIGNAFSRLLVQDKSVAVSLKFTNATFLLPKKMMMVSRKLRICGCVQLPKDISKGRTKNEILWWLVIGCFLKLMKTWFSMTMASPKTPTCHEV
jgi:hypothetical protein